METLDLSAVIPGPLYLEGELERVFFGGYAIVPRAFAHQLVLMMALPMVVRLYLILAGALRSSQQFKVPENSSSLNRNAPTLVRISHCASSKAD